MKSVRIYIGDFEDQEVQLKGWLYNKRSEAESYTFSSFGMGAG